MYITYDEALKLSVPDRENLVVTRGMKAIVPQYTVVYEEDEDTVHSLALSGIWMAMLMHGNCIPPIEVYLRDDAREKLCRETNKPYPRWEQVYAPPMREGMTEEQATEYIMMKDVSPRIWQDTTRNRPLYYICRNDQLPDRIFRDAWRLAA